MKNYLFALCISLVLPAVSQAAIITFDFTGRLVVVDPSDNLFSNNGQPYTPISASLSYDTVSGIGSSGMTITMAQPWNGNVATFHDISMTRQTGTNLITGQVLVDWGTPNMPLHIEWDATGLFNAINLGLQPGDVLSGTDLYFDANGNGVQDIGEYRADIGSAMPYSETYVDAYHSLIGVTPGYMPEGPAPLAATANTMGLDGTTPFPGFRGFINIGSGNSMHVTSVSNIPIPAAVWLFGSGLLGLVGVARRKKAAE